MLFRAFRRSDARDNADGVARRYWPRRAADADRTCSAGTRRPRLDGRRRSGNACLVETELASILIRDQVQLPVTITSSHFALVQILPSPLVPPCGGGLGWGASFQSGGCNKAANPPPWPPPQGGRGLSRRSAHMTTERKTEYQSVLERVRFSPSDVFEVEHEVLDFAEGGADVVFGPAVDGRLEVGEHRPQLLGVLGIGLGQRAPRPWRPGPWRSRSPGGGPGDRSSSARTVRLVVLGPGPSAHSTVLYGTSSVPKTASRRSTASLRWLWRNRSIALSITTCLASPVARSVAVTLRIPFKSRSSRTRIWLPAGTSASPSITNSPTKVL